MGYRIGSFNLRNLGLAAMGNGNSRNLRTIANIIRDEGFDVVALQEVLSQGKAFMSEDYAKKSILMELGPDWDFSWADAGSESDPRHEGFAFVWRKSKLRLSSTMVNTRYGTVERVFYPRMCKTSQADLFRRPYYGRFTTQGVLGGPNVEFRLVCVHTYYGKTDSIADREIRQKELDVLMKEVYPQLSDRRYGDPLDSYTILLGDYNAELWTTETRRWQEPLKAIRGGKKPAIIKTDGDGVVYSQKYGNRAIKTVQDQLSTLKVKQSDQGEESFDTSGYSYNYDHFSYDEKRFEGVRIRVKCLRNVVNDYCLPVNGDYETDFEKYYHTVSDHIPIIMEIDIR